MPIIVIRGIVQGVGFRPAVYRLARSLKLKGHVLNTGSNVEVVIDGDPEEFMTALKAALPPMARIDGYKVEDCPGPTGDFAIIPSSRGARDSPVPPDAALCDECLRELLSPDDRRHLYPFSNCTDCGARFSVIDDLPYDRKNTSMADFPICGRCLDEYGDPDNRRFHAQTVSCPDCGPRYYLASNTDHEVMGDPALKGAGRNDTGRSAGAVAGEGGRDPVGDFARAVDAGRIGAVKSWGGTHIVCIPEAIGRLRSLFHRPQKPLAVMVRDLEAAGKYARISEHDKELLMSPARPIVLLKMKGDYLAATAPGLDRIGIYLPYSGFHHLMFAGMAHDAVIMTSGNEPGEPMAVTDDEILALPAEIHLLHDRRIANRIDDSVVIPHDGSRFIVRRSRGFVPAPIDLPHKASLVAVGGDMNCTGAISVGGQAVLTQHIGDVGRYRTAEFLVMAIKHLMKLRGMDRPEAVVADMHPRYSSRQVGKRLAGEWGVPLMEMQHHAAHGFALTAEHGIDRLRVLACDGTGYGDDGQIWGGEVLDIRRGMYERVGHLAYIPLLGGDRAVEDPARVVFAICERLGMEQPYFSGAEEEVLGAMMGRSVGTSSTGRVLDALSCWLGICREMTYDGEPAMKLEPYIARGRESYRFRAVVNGRIVDTVDLFAQLAGHAVPGAELGDRKKSDLARSFVRALLEGLVEAADPDDALGFTGGVSYNLAINSMLRDILEKRGAKLITHRFVPNGDGGISFGQLAGGGLNVSGNTR